MRIAFLKSFTFASVFALGLAGCGGVCGSEVTSRNLNPVFCADDGNRCARGTRSVDLDSDACADRCETPSCETFAPVVCGSGQMPVDADGDGCARECPPTTATFCGGFIGAPCGAGQYCDYPLDASCGAADQTGVCRDSPDACAEISAPVCGCGGATYANECAAHAAGVSVAHWGPCDPVVCPAIAFLCTADTHPGDTDHDGCDDGCVPNGGPCGGLTPSGSPTCGPTEFCAYEPGQLCGAADASSICRPRPEVCTAQSAPVCGCDAKTYGNACVANSYGTGILHEGACDVVCPAYYPICQGGAAPIDSNHDGCALECP